MRRYIPQVSMAASGFDREFGAALEHTGFAVVTDHPISAALLDAAYDMAEMVFALPDQYLKDRYDRPEIGRQRGYTPYAQEHAKDQKFGDLKSFWHAGREGVEGFEPNVWPEEVPQFQPIMMQLFRALDEMSMVLLDALDRYLQQPQGTLRAMVERGNTLLRVLHYPELKDHQNAQGIRSSAHEDINLITLLVAATASGLQVKNKAGQWVDVNETPGSIVVNVGDMLQLFTGWRFPSTTHRVLNLPGKRLSMPFFVHPRSEVVLHAQSGYTAWDYLRYRLVEIGLLEGDLAMLRSPPQP